MQDLQVIDSPLSLVHLPYFFPTYQEDEASESFRGDYIALFPLIIWGWGLYVLEFRKVTGSLLPLFLDKRKFPHLSLRLDN